MKKLILLIAILNIFGSCGIFEAKAVLEKFLDSEVILSDDFEYLHEGRDTTFDVLNGLDSKLIVYFETKSCSTCEVPYINKYQEIINYNKWTKGKFGIVFIFAPKSESYEEVKRAIERNKTQGAIVLLDRNGGFIKQNPNIPKNRRYHIFMVDKDNKVVLVGNPLGNEKMWNLYKKEIAKLSK